MTRATKVCRKKKVRMIQAGSISAAFTVKASVKELAALPPLQRKAFMQGLAEVLNYEVAK